MATITKDELEAVEANCHHCLDATYDARGNLRSLVVRYSKGSEAVRASWKLTLDPENLKADAERTIIDVFPAQDEPEEAEDDDEFQSWLDDSVNAILEGGGYLSGWKCNFCYKSNEEVSKLLTGSAACICNECVELMAEICEEDD